MENYVEQEKKHFLFLFNILFVGLFIATVILGLLAFTPMGQSIDVDSLLNIRRAFTVILLLFTSLLLWVVLTQNGQLAFSRLRFFFLHPVVYKSIDGVIGFTVLIVGFVVIAHMIH